MEKYTSKNMKREKRCIQLNKLEKQPKRNNRYSWSKYFTKLEYSYDLSARMRELSYLNKGITITFTDKRN
jgi:DNA gyrase subunit B